ncbi:MAG: Na(+)/H(+) antiporter subunit D [Rhodospirillaceae bacterium]|jgi:multicomponent Na+:H+ antiporter subunit D|nr:Na(+)/H(+) antiporter subunit D [Rhodospirillaceae bacterium]|tara:strand:- start:5896 stop:7587 length:1692 start_codon:yes stop_codon:yes gene_type:complete
MSSALAPFLIFFAGAVLVALTRGWARSVVLLAVPIVGALNLWALDGAEPVTVGLLDYTLTIARADRLSMLFGYVFHLAAFLGFIFALHLKDTTESVSSMLYAGSALGAVFAGDMITLFIFWELMVVTSVFLILARRTERARAAAMRYLLIQVLSGVILLSGVLIRAYETGSIAFDFIGWSGLSSSLILLAFGIKAAFPLLHNWLTDAYPEATPTGTVFLSVFSTKVAVYALARAFPGTEMLIYVGATMAMFPIFYAVIENDLRRVLSYSLINQVGFMVTGIGIGTEMALNGAVSHAFAHIIYKALLFMSMGAVLFRTGKINGSELGGLYKSMPKTAVLCIVGAASISAFPLFSGFVSKSMILVSALEEGYPAVWLALLFASAGVFHHSGIKIPFFAFFAHDSGIRCKEAPTNMVIAMFLAAFVCVFLGVYPWPLYDILPFPVDYDPYTAAHVLAQSQLLFFSALAFCALKLTGLYPPELPGINIDVDWAYRRFMPRSVRYLMAAFSPVDKKMRKTFIGVVNKAINGAFQYVGPKGVLARALPAGAMVFWTIALLAGFLVVYLI